MTAYYLLDSNILSDLVRNPLGQIAERIADVGLEHVCTSIVVAAELRYGAAKKGSSRISERVENVLTRLPVLPLKVPADAFYGAVRTDLERKGQIIGHFDFLIAAHALAEGCILVTDNEREFSRVEGLKVENWLR